MIKIFFASIFSIFPDNLAIKEYGLKDLILRSAFTILVLAQRLKLLWSYSLDFHNWDELKYIWYGLSYLSPDSLSAGINQLSCFLIFTLSLLTVNISLLILNYLIVLFNKKPPRIMLYLLKYSLKFSNSLLFIPFIMVLVIFFKYSTSENSRITEYSNSMISDFFSFGGYGKLLAAIALILHLTTSLITEGFDVNLNIHSAQSDIDSKTTINGEILMKIVLFFICCAYPFIFPKKYIIYLLTQTLFSSLSLYYFSTRLPYYSTFAMYLKIWENLEIFSISLFFILGYIMNNAAVTLLLSLILQPIILILTKILMNPETLNFTVSKGLSYSLFISQSKHLLISPISQKTVFKSFFQAFYECKNKLILPQVAYYCSEIIENYSLGAIKVSLASYKGLNIFNNYQVFKCQEILKNIMKKESFGLKILQFIERQEKTLASDKMYCLQYLKMIDSILDKKHSYKDIEENLLNSLNFIKKTGKRYKKLSDSNPDSSIADSLYGSFLIDILGKFEDGQLYIARSQSSSFKKSGKLDPKAILCDRSLPTLIFSGNFSNMGKILYASPSICSILQLPLEEVKSCLIFGFLPKIADIDYSYLLRKVISIGTSQYVAFNSSIFILNSSGFLIECIVYIECIAIESDIKFLCIIDQVLSKKRQVAILDRNMVIVNSTENLNLLLSIPYYKLDLLNIQTLLPVDTYEELISKGSSLLPSLLYKDLIILLKKTHIGKHEVFVFYVLLEKNEIEKILFQDEASQVLELLKDKKRVSKVQNDFKSRSVPANKAIKEGRASIINNDANLNTEKEVNNVTQSAKNLNLSNNLSKTIKKTRKIFKVLKGLIVLLVVMLLIAGICGLAFAIYNINKISKVDTIQVYGKISSEMTKLALHIRSSDHSIHYKQPFFFPLENIKKDIINLKSLKNKLRSGRENLSFCSNYKIFSENLMPEKFLNYKKINLKNYLDNTLNQALNVYNDLTNGKEVKSENLCYIIFNSYNIITDTLKETLKTSEDCEINRNKELQFILMILTLATVSIFCLFYLLILAVSIRIHKKSRQIWESFIKIVNFHEGSIKQRIITRLTSTHNFEMPENTEKKSKKRENFFHNFFLQYAAVTFPLFLISSGICILFYYGFYIEISKLLTFRIEFLNIMINRRIFFIKVAYYTMEIVTKENMIQNKCLNITMDSDPYTSLFELNEELVELRNIFNKKNLIGYLPEESYNLFFQKFDSDANFLKLGTSSAFTYFRFESFFYSFNEKTKFSELEKYFSEISTMSDSFEVIFDIVDNSSLNMIWYKFKLILMYFILTISFGSILVLTLYLPYFTKKSKIIKFIGSIFNYITTITSDSTTT